MNSVFYGKVMSLNTPRHGCSRPHKAPLGILPTVCSLELLMTHNCTENLLDSERAIQVTGQGGFIMLVIFTV